MQREENFEMRKFVRKFSGVPPKGSVYYLCGSDYSRKLMEMCHNKCLKNYFLTPGKFLACQAT